MSQKIEKKSSNLNRRKFLITATSSIASAAAPSLASTKPVYDVMIVGAGLSGLHAATLLEEQGLSVRIGGRVYTLMDIPGKPEAAGEIIGANYARMIYAAESNGLELVEPEAISESANRGLYYRIRGQNILAEEWPEHPLNPMEGKDRKLLPNRMLWTLSHYDNPLSGRALDDWLKPEFQKYDIPMATYLKNNLGFNDETIRLMNTVVHTENMENTSALHELRRYAVGEFNSKMAEQQYGQDKWLQVKGGNSLLPAAMAKSLKNGVLLNKTVFAFEQNNDEVRVHCGDGSQYLARNVVCSIPYPVLQKVTFSPRLPEVTAKAIAEIDYGISIQVHFLIKKRFWEEDGLPPSIWSDTPFERFAVLWRGQGGEATSAIAFINGDEAFKYDFMTDQQVATYTLQELIKARPSLEGALEPVLVQSCHRDVHGAGDWVFWQPGQVVRYANNMRAPHGRIHFCGEHTAIMERGMEGAFESGERAAFDILANL